MRTIFKFAIISLLFVSTLSCKKYLDVAPDNIATIDYAFRNRNEAENYLFTCYSAIQKGGIGDVMKNPGFTTSGEIVYRIGDPGFDILRGTQNVTAPSLNYWDGENNGTHLFRVIRRCNIFLENIDKPVDLVVAEKKRWIAEVKFLKAYYHYWLVRMYGPIPVIRKNLPIASTSEEVRVKREPVDSAFNYIAQLLDEAAVDLPTIIENEVAEMGRITRPIALSVKAEVLTTQASPLYNGNPDYANFRDKDGQLLFSTQPDLEKWKRAAEACKVAIDACAQAGIKLYQFVPSVNINNISDSTRQLLTLQNAFTDKWNSEVIWSNNVLFPYQNMCVARLNVDAFRNDWIHSSFSIPLHQAELFYTDNGVPMNEDKSWNHANRYSLETAGSSSRFYIKQGYTTVKMHFNREPRFYADLGFDGGIWYGNGTLDDSKALHVQAKFRQPAGVKDGFRNNLTGYFAKKLVHYQSVYLQNNAPFDYPWPMMRLAGLYLLYAEALNEAYGPSGEGYEYIDAVRARAGLEGVRESWASYSTMPEKATTKEGLREIIHRERRIELCFEGQSGWDLRRWKELQGVLSNPIQGWDIYQEEAKNYYRPRNVFIPVFSTRDYLWPIKENNLIINPNLVQNPYWQ